MAKIERETPKSSSTNLKEDALCKVLGPEKHGRLRTFGKGVTLTKLSVLSQMSGHLAQLHEENVKYKSQVARMQDTIDELKKNQAQNAAPAEGTPTTPIVSPSRVTTTPDSDSCKLLDWTGTGEVVAEGHWSSSDPNEFVHHMRLGPNAMRVWVDVPKKGEAFLWRPTSFMEKIEDAVGTTIAWPADKVLMDSMPRIVKSSKLPFSKAVHNEKDEEDDTKDGMENNSAEVEKNNEVEAIKADMGKNNALVEHGEEPNQAIQDFGEGDKREIEDPDFPTLSGKDEMSAFDETPCFIGVQDIDADPLLSHPPLFASDE
ncbi:hypothetical protein Vadar_020951 [Vaccinium darrowii]|uniref:Uncharacterized protein n=1 Tax=Vaccinium darrowii TaxID=229202 RepID=A0ACB7XRZ6_9ERIC|nr:hypothetical protein Vadar_020951 [Vaccinium darrowii]